MVPYCMSPFVLNRLKSCLGLKSLRPTFIFTSIDKHLQTQIILLNENPQKEMKVKHWNAKTNIVHTTHYKFMQTSHYEISVKAPTALRPRRWWAECESWSGACAVSINCHCACWSERSEKRDSVLFEWLLDVVKNDEVCISIKRMCTGDRLHGREHRGGIINMS